MKAAGDIYTEWFFKKRGDAEESTFAVMALAQTAWSALFSLVLIFFDPLYDPLNPFIGNKLQI